MMVRRTFIGLLAIPMIWTATACADSLRIGAISNQKSPSEASAGGSINVSNHTPAVNGTPGDHEGASGSIESPAVQGGQEPTLPTISSSSPRYSNPHPYGSGSFWYEAEGGHRCAYVPASDGICFTVVQPEAGQPAQPPINPAAIAAGLASQMSLQAGNIAVSPSAHAAGLTGAASWFWLEPSPTGHAVSVSLHGERVTVSANAASVQWSFGESPDVVAGPGVPYRPGGVPAGAVRHAYQTRCLPGDRGHDPYVLSSCGPSGYTVEALVQWGISYTASGPVAGGGALPTRSTATSIAYPVGEARAFLTTAGGGS